ncbi:MAG TPA: hypothetical protein VGR96_19700 [Acidobacteriaceae bacterium]|nr:hypothetical protein [Acidobacteriaceae bacterium]
MANTAVGLFENSAFADEVALELKTAGIAPKDVLVVAEPLEMPVTSVLSTPHTDFSLALLRELREVGASEIEAEAYVTGVSRGGVLVFATGSPAQVDSAAEIMNRHHAAEVGELSGAEPVLPSRISGAVGSKRSESTLTGRIRSSDGGARIFVW